MNPISSDRYVNEQNARFWAFENPKVIHQRPLRVSKVRVACGVTFSRIVGPYFFEDANGNAVFINGDQYRQMIRDYLLPEMRNMNVENIFFLQDGATSHTARESSEMMK